MPTIAMIGLDCCQDPRAPCRSPRCVAGAQVSEPFSALRLHFQEARSEAGVGRTGTRILVWDMVTATGRLTQCVATSRVFFLFVCF